MTLQQIADYAMEYLDSKGIAADYDYSYLSREVWVSSGRGDIVFYCGETKKGIEESLSLAINCGAI